MSSNDIESILTRLSAPRPLREPAKLRTEPSEHGWNDAKRFAAPDEAQVEWSLDQTEWRFKPQKLVSLSNQPIDPVAEAKRRDAKQETQFTAHVIEVMKARYLDEFKAEADPDIRDLMESDETFSSARKRLPELLNADPASNASTDASLSIELETAIEADDDKLFSNTDGPEVAALRVRIAELEAERDAQAAQSPAPDPIDVARAINARLLHKDDDLPPQAPSDWDMDGQGVVEAVEAEPDDPEKEALREQVADLQRQIAERDAEPPPLSPDPVKHMIPEEIRKLMLDDETLPQARQRLWPVLNAELSELKNQEALFNRTEPRRAEVEQLISILARLGEG